MSDKVFTAFMHKFLQAFCGPPIIPMEAS
ncbi:hypothetical protein RSAG8_05566, partial [Rhizoctonia solani AG-8 WAC10335]